MSARLIYYTLAALIALLIPVQMTIGQTANIVGLRINAADLLMPLAILTGLYLLWRRAPWPQFRVPHLPLWLLGLSAIIILSFINGALIYQEVSPWALINRLIGWFILLGFFAIGAGVVTWLTAQQQLRLITLFLAGIWATTLICALFIIFFPADQVMLLPRPLLYPLQGMMGDRNAFALVFICAFTLNIALAAALPDKRMLKYMAVFAITIAPAFAYLNYSLSGMITLGVLFALLLIFNFRSFGKTMALALVCGLLLLTGMLQIYEQHKSGFNIVTRLDVIGQAVVKSETSLYSSDRLRLETYTQALTLWQDRPFLGIGLGGFMTVRDQNQQTLAVLDSTPIWILTEMGLLGLIAFLAFGGAVARALCFGPDEPDPIPRALLQAGIVILIGFVMMSSILQLLYIRPLWFLMGMVLTKPRQNGLPSP